MSTNLHYKSYRKLLFKILSYASFIVIILITTISQAYAGKVEISLSYNDPIPVSAPNTVDLTAPAVTEGSFAIETGWPIDPILSYAYFLDEELTLPISDPVHINKTGRYYIKAKAYSHTGTLYTSSGSVWVTIDQVICTNSYISPVTSGVVPSYTWAAPVIDPVGSITGGSAQETPTPLIGMLLTNTSNAPATAIYTIQVFQNGVPFQFPLKIEVYPQGKVNTIDNFSNCSGDLISPINFETINTGGLTNYSWTNNLPSIGLAASGTGNIGSFIAVNTGNVPLVATIEVTPTFNNNGINCTGPLNKMTFTITVNPVPILSSDLVPMSICSGTTFNYTPTSAIQGATFSWSRATIPGILQVGTTGTGNVNEVLTNSTSEPIIVTYNYTIFANGCSNTQEVKIPVLGKLNAALSGGTSPICYNTSPGILTATGIGGTGSYSYLWYKDGKSTGVTTSTYLPGNLISTSSIYCAITSGSCGTVNTNTKTITVLEDLTAGISGGTSPICYNTSPGILTATGNGGSGSYSYLWYKDGISTGITTPTYTPGNLVNTSEFYCAVTSGLCGTVNTSKKTITVNPDLSAGLSGGTSPVCYNTAPGILTATGSGGSGSYSYLWYKDGKSTGVTTPTYLSGNLISNSTFYCAITSGSCGTVNTNTKTITVLANLSASLSGGSSPVCYNTAPGILTATGSGGTGTYTYLWYKDGISTGITTSTYSPDNLISNSTFYCAITSGSCETVNTSKKTITVLEDLTASIGGGSSPICYNTAPGILTSTGNGGSGTYSYLWYQDGKSTGVTTPAYTPGNLISNSIFYCAITGGACGTVNTSKKTITVYPELTAGISGGTSPICYNTSPGILTATGNGGSGSYSYLWFKDGVSTGITTPTYSPDKLISNSTFYCAITSGSCETVNTIKKAITVLSDLTAGISGGTSPICYNTSPGILTATGSGGIGSYSYLWYKDGISTGATTPTYTPGSLDSTSTFYCAITDGICGTVNTSKKTITVYPDLTASIGGGTSPICYNTSPGILTATGHGGSGLYSYLWYKDGISTGVTTPTYMPGNLNNTSEFYCAITGGTCGTVNTSKKTITVYPDITAGISGGTSAVCYNAPPGILAATGNGGSGVYSYLWYKDGKSTDVTTPTYSPGNLVSNSTFYCAITSGSCGTVNTSVKTISVTPTVTINSFSPASSSRRQGAESISITTSASNNSSAIVYSLDPISSAFAGNSIDSSTGIVTFSANWSGNATITASAAGCNGPATTSQVVTTYIPSIALIKSGTFVDKSPVGVVNPGDQIIYKFTVTNTGSVALTNVIVTDPLVIVNGGPIASLAPGSVDNTTFTAIYNITQENINSGAVRNQANVKGTPPTGSDVTDLSDDDSNLQNESTITVLTQSPAWSISKEARETSYSAIGELLHYIITVTNKGNVYIENIVVTDPGADSGSTLYVSGDLNKNNRLDPAESWIYSANHTVNKSDMITGHYFNTVQAKGTPSGGTLLPSTGSKDIFAKQTLTVSNASANEGDNVVFQVALNYPGLSEVTFIPKLSGNTAIVGVDTKPEVEFSNNDGSIWTKCNSCTITIPSGASGIQLRVPTINDNIEEQTEIFTISVTVTSTNTVNSNASGVGSIIDNDEYPIAVDDIFTVDEDSRLKANCSVNDFPNSAGNKWNLVKQSIHGKTQMNADGSFTYIPDADYNGIDNFIYELCDLDGDCYKATVNLTVKPVNDIPVANDDDFTMKLDYVLNESVAVNDVPSPDGGNIWTIVTPPKGGVVVLNSDGSFNYTLNSDFSGSDTFVYKLCDQDGSCVQATVRISVEDIVPNQILTPNNDGINDTFFIENIESYPGNKTTIYNRWGNIVYQKSGYLNEWDGTSNMGKVGSKTVPVGTYYFVIDYGNNRHKVGFVYLQKSNR